MRGVLIEVLKEIIIKQAGNLQKFLGIKGVFLDKPTYLCRVTSKMAANCVWVIFNSFNLDSMLLPTCA